MCILAFVILYLCSIYKVEKYILLENCFLSLNIYPIHLRTSWHEEDVEKKLLIESTFQGLFNLLLLIITDSLFFLPSRSETTSSQQHSFNGKVHNNKRFAFGVLDNEDSSRDVIPSKAGFISRRGVGGVDDNGDEVDDDRQALIPLSNGELRSADNDGRRLSRDDDLNEVSTEGVVNGMYIKFVGQEFYRFLKLST